MLGVNTKNKETQLQPDFFEILVCKNQDNRPFLNVFRGIGNNFEEKKIGTIFGVIQALDFSKNSEYLPNLLSQIIKKEFYRYPKEGLEQCFENALHKANLALSDLARHDIIQWIGKLDAAIGVICGDDVLISQAGEGKVFLLREKKFIEITQSTDAGEKEVHPVKTFSEILSGKIQPADKLIFTTEEIFRSLKEEEIKRHSKVFNPYEFDNLIRSSLELEADNVGAVVINIRRKEIFRYDAPEEKKEEANVNFFGSQLPVKSEKQKFQEEKKTVKEAPEKEIVLPAEEKKDSLSFNSEFYIKEQEPADSEKNQPVNFIRILNTAKRKIYLVKKPKKFAIFVGKSCFNGSKKLFYWIKNADYSKLKKAGKTFANGLKSAFQKSKKLAIAVKNQIQNGLNYLKKKYLVYKENKERKKKLDKF